ncbi:MULTISPECIES: EF-P lysine aminoacylase EpmA [Methylomonas]|uniref:EF-P lysine aminoacylase EpmA n=1 Tax=Methylomonas TaxID=416 RepID=UPI001232DEA3|nr:EF-P lysine aminoacylase EpmA [Methylomonas rhizoryzae]
MTEDWQPTADLSQLKSRASLLAAIRQFFAQREVMEVETPLLCHTTGTDPNLAFFRADYAGTTPQTLFLQTSPEFAMKRLLAAGTGSIYQICKAFRNGEAGRYHNPEFTILEWYRVGFDLQRLMDEVTALLTGYLTAFFPELLVERASYRDWFLRYSGIDPLDFNAPVYRAFAEQIGLPEAAELCGDHHALWLDLLFSHHLQNRLPVNTICLIYDYPSVQSSLARLHPADPRICQRFEVFINGVELGNGYYELRDAVEQEARFDAEIQFRTRQGLTPVCKDRRLLAALSQGLPDCSGVAIGLDRLLMVAGQAQDISQVLAFPIGRA